MEQSINTEKTLHEEEKSKKSIKKFINDIFALFTMSKKQEEMLMQELHNTMKLADEKMNKHLGIKKESIH